MATAAVNPKPQDDAPDDPIWDRAASLRLCLRDGVQVDAVPYRGSRWHLLRNRFNRRQVRLSEPLYRVLARLDGRRTLAEAVDAEPTVDRHELVSALGQLKSAGMLDDGLPVDLERLIAQRTALTRQQRLTRWLRILSPRLPLVDPDRFLGAALPFLGWLLNPAALFAWLAIALAAGVLALMHWDGIMEFGAQRLDDPRQWLLLVAVYPVVKALHELGHGIVAKAGGAEVNEMGITLLVFLPVPYVDATAASAFASKARRMLVGAAGIMVEVALASLALFAWLVLDDGLAREIAFTVMLIGGVSTVLFNGNPLLRFDGYYVLADAIEIPNLASRSARYYGYLARRYLLGVHAERPPVNAPGERPWFLFYGLASTLYGIAISLLIALFLIATVPVLGSMLAAWLLFARLLLPLLRQGRFLLFSPTLADRRPRAVAVVGASLAVVLAVLGLLPMPVNTQVDGVVLLPERAVVRADVDGFLRCEYVVDGEHVVVGTQLFELGNAELTTDIALVRARLRELEARRDAAGIDDRLAREIQRERLQEVREELAELEQRHAGLLVRSPGAGEFRFARAADRVGRFVQQGEMLGYLADPADAVVRVVANQQDASRIRAGSERIRVRFADRLGAIAKAVLLGEVPQATERLPSAALGSLGGGAIAVDTRDGRGVTALQPVFAFDLQVPASLAAQFVGGRVFVRFEHQSAALLPRWYDAARRRLLHDIGA